MAVQWRYLKKKMLVISFSSPVPVGNVIFQLSYRGIDDFTLRERQFICKSIVNSKKAAFLPPSLSPRQNTTSPCLST